MSSIINLLQCCIADCVIWVPRLTLWDLLIDWTYHVLLERNSFACRGLTDKPGLYILGSSMLVAQWWVLP